MNAHQRRIRSRKIRRSYVPSGVMVAEIDKSTLVVNQGSVVPAVFLVPRKIYDVNELAQEIFLGYKSICLDEQYNDALARKRMTDVLLNISTRFTQLSLIKITCDETNNPVTVIDNNDLVVDVYLLQTDGRQFWFTMSQPAGQPALIRWQSYTTPDVPV